MRLMNKCAACPAVAVCEDDAFPVLLECNDMQEAYRIMYKHIYPAAEQARANHPAGSDLFNRITADPSTLAANIVRHAHQSITAWARMRGIKAEFTDADYLHDLAAMEACLSKEAKQVGALVVEAKL